MQSLLYVKASDGVANASLMTVSTVRSAGASTILTNTVANAPAYFYATMGTPHTFTDPVTGETITVISEATAVDFAGRVDSGHIEIVAIAPGYTDLGSAVGDIIVIRPITEWANNIFNVLNQAHQDDGKLKTTSLDHFFKPNELINNFVASGGIVAVSSGLTGTLSDTIYYINGLRYSKTSIPNKTYTATKDTYVDIDTAGTITYTEVTVGAAAPALAANNIRLAKVTTNGSTLTTITQGAYDSLGNIIRPNNIANIVSGSNANGTYLMFPDGTLICQRRFSTEGANNNGGSTLYYSSSGTNWTFPMPFLTGTVPALQAGIDSGAADMWGGGRSVSNTVATCALYAGRLRSGPYDISWVATGRWK